MKQLSELVDLAELQTIFHNFAEVTGLGVSLRDPDGREMLSFYPGGGACICRMLHADRLCTDSVSFSARKAGELGEPYIYTCGCGLVMSASAILLEDVLLGAVFCGPTRLWDADDFALDELKEHTRRTALTAEERQRIIRNTPGYTCEQMTSASAILFRLISFMCRSGSDLLRQKQEITRQQATISLLMAESKQLPTPPLGGFYSPESEREFLTKVRIGDRSGAKKQLNSLLADIFLSSGGRLSSMKAKIYELNGFLFRTASETGVTGERLLDIAREAQGLLVDTVSFEELCYRTSHLLEAYLDAVYDTRPDIAGLRYLRAATEYISRSYSLPLTCASVAEEVHISPSYLAHLFHDGLSASFTEYLARVRVEAAKELLQTTDLPISVLAERVGYADCNYFIRVFKKAMGITPHQFRQVSGNRPANGQERKL